MIKRKHHSLHKSIGYVGILGLSLLATSCFEDDDNTDVYAEWREQNIQYVKEAEAFKDNDNFYYKKIEPDWAPQAYSLVHWHNDTVLTSKNLQPLDNSTVEITYELFDIEGNRLSDSFSNTDSLYKSKPNQNIVGVWAPLTNMHVGDSVTIVIPSQAGYGSRPYGAIKPYSTLIYNIKLKNISAYEVE